MAKRPVLLLPLALLAAGSIRAEEPIRLIAHRGGVVDQHHPENSASAAEEAIRRGYWMLEMDLQESKDGRLVVHHDGDFVKSYGVHKKQGDLTWDEIRQFRAVEDGSRPLEFREYAAMCRGKVQLMIDTKEPSHPRAFYEELERTLRENGLLEGAYFIGTVEARAWFKGKSRISVDGEELRKLVDTGAETARLYFLFEHGTTLDEKGMALARRAGIPAVVSINDFHYSGDHMKQAHADIDRLRRAGLTYFQIDSAYDMWLRPGEGEVKPALVFLVAALPLAGQSSGLEFLNGNRPVVDAHNCYPYKGQWADRLSRALASGYPKGIEQDLAWSVDQATGKGRVVVSHSDKTTGTEPSLRDHFFEAVRPIVEKALKEDNRAQWPMIVLHFDVKDNRPELLHSVWELLGEYETWITTAPKSPDKGHLEAFSAKPILVLTEDSDAQEKVFYDEVPVGERLRLFGSAHTNRIPGDTREERAHNAATMAPGRLLTEKPTNYRRWWNNSWFEVEGGGQTRAGDWTADDARRLRALVDHAHRLGFWIRFYTLDGFTEKDNKGWDAGYNFGSREAVVERWKAALEAGVNLIATDQYEDLAGLASESQK